MKAYRHGKVLFSMKTDDDKWTVSRDFEKQRGEQCTGLLILHAGWFCGTRALWYADGTTVSELSSDGPGIPGPSSDVPGISGSLPDVPGISASVPDDPPVFVASPDGSRILVSLAGVPAGSWSLPDVSGVFAASVLVGAGDAALLAICAASPLASVPSGLRIPTRNSSLHAL